MKSTLLLLLSMRLTFGRCGLVFCCLLFPVSVSWAAPGGAARTSEPIDLKGVRAIAEWATHYHYPRMPMPEILDGDTNTFWVSGGSVSLRDKPGNLSIILPKPRALGKVEVDTAVGKDGNIYAKTLEVYGWTGAGWALLGREAAAAKTPVTIELKPAEVRLLRVRITASGKPGNTIGMLYDVRLYAPPAGTPLASPQAGPVIEPAPGEDARIGEFVSWLIERGLDRGFGDTEKAPPPIKFDPAVGYLGYARAFMDTMLKFGTDRYGAVHSPMFMSILDVVHCEHPGYVIRAMPWQREGDRAHYGCNLQHDVPLLEAMGYMSDITGDARYRKAARDYLAFWLEHATRTPTGLWPWGEHPYWDCYREALGENSRSHEYDGDITSEFWEMLWKLDSKAVLREADGLIYHIIDLKTFAYNRHAAVDKILPDPRPEALKPLALDFTRQGGYFIHLWAFAYAKTGEKRYADWIGRMLDYFEEIRIPETGLLPVLSKYSARPQRDPQQGGSEAASLHAAMPYLKGTAIGERTAGFLARLVEALPRLPLPKFNANTSLLGEGIGVTGGGASPARDALALVERYRLFGHKRDLDAAREIALAYAEAQVPLKSASPIQARVFGSILDLLMDMHELDGHERWLKAAERYAQWTIESLHANGLFRGATGLWYYESHMSVCKVVYALVRLHTLVEHTRVKVPPNYFLK